MNSPVLTVTYFKIFSSAILSILKKGQFQILTTFSNFLAFPRILLIDPSVPLTIGKCVTFIFHKDLFWFFFNKNLIFIQVFSLKLCAAKIETYRIWVLKSYRPDSLFRIGEAHWRVDNFFQHLFVLTAFLFLFTLISPYLLK